MGQLFKSGKKFVAKDHKEMGNFDPLPVGEYIASLKEAEMKENSNKNGSFLKLKFKIVEGDYKDRFLFTNLNLDHPKAETVKMAEEEFATLCNAMGISGAQDTEELLGQDDIVLKVRVTKATANYPAGNAIKGYKAAGGIGGSSKPSRPSSDSSDDEPAVKKKKPKVSFD